MVLLQTPRLVGAGQTVVRSITTWCHGHLHAENLGPVAGVAWPILLAVALVAAMTLCLIGVKQFVDLYHVSSAYLIPVLIASIWLGMVPVFVVAIGGVAASAFFFYAPI